MLANVSAAEVFIGISTYSNRYMVKIVGPHDVSRLDAPLFTPKAFVSELYHLIQSLRVVFVEARNLHVCDMREIPARRQFEL
jgi:hypothetical protein